MCIFNEWTVTDAFFLLLHRGFFLVSYHISRRHLLVYEISSYSTAIKDEWENIALWIYRLVTYLGY